MWLTKLFRIPAVTKVRRNPDQGPETYTKSKSDDPSSEEMRDNAIFGIRGTSIFHHRAHFGILFNWNRFDFCVDILLEIMKIFALKYKLYFSIRGAFVKDTGFIVMAYIINSYQYVSYKLKIKKTLLL